MYDSIIIGCGAAGMTAALNILRNGKTVLILEKESIGGQIATSPKVENYPSIKAISGLDFSTQLFDQISDLGAEFEFEEVTELEKEDDIFKVTTNYNTYEAKTVVIACGAEHNIIKAKGTDKKGVSYCALCDGAFYKGEEVSVIGDANTALQYALLLAGICPKVNLCMLFDHYFGDQYLVDKVEKKENIKVYKELLLESVNGGDEMESLTFKNTKTGEEIVINSKAVFVAIGQTPKTDIYSHLVDRNKQYIITNENMETKTDGLYAIGDCRNKEVRQLTTATSDGAICAVGINKYLS